MLLLNLMLVTVFVILLTISVSEIADARRVRQRGDARSEP
jgi:hypothetical protein